MEKQSEIALAEDVPNKISPIACKPEGGGAEATAVEGAPSLRLTPRLAIGLILLQSLFFGLGDPISKEAYHVVPVYALLSMDGLDALLATVQMPGGIPVATVAINGAKNAAVLAAQILAVSDDALSARLDEARSVMAAQIAEKEEKLQAELYNG